MLNEIQQPTKPARRDVFTPIYQVLTLLLLLGIGLILFLGLFRKSSLTTECQAAITKADTVFAGQIDLVQGLNSAYEKDVYNDPSVKTITQQTFLANQYEFTALQMIALQNAMLLDITTKCH